MPIWYLPKQRRMDHGNNLDLADEEKEIIELSKPKETSQLGKVDVEGN